MAAYGIVATHVAFQTATGSAVLERFDYFVAVFFALSAFLLARGGMRPGYAARRVARPLRPRISARCFPPRICRPRTSSRAVSPHDARAAASC